MTEIDDFLWTCSPQWMVEQVSLINLAVLNPPRRAGMKGDGVPVGTYLDLLEARPVTRDQTRQGFRDKRLKVLRIAASMELQRPLMETGEDVPREPHSDGRAEAEKPTEKEAKT